MTKTRAQKQKRSRHADEQLLAAMAQFNLHYGRDETKLEKWQLLCDDCGIGRGRSIKKCKARLRGIAVNIWDLLKARADGNLPVRKFRSKNELRLDLEKPGRRFPLGRLKQLEDNKLLQALLITMA